MMEDFWQRATFYKRFLESIENDIQLRYKYIAENVNRKYKSISSDIKEEVISDSIIEEAGNYDFSLYSSFILAIYAFFEQTLVQICRDYENNSASKIKYKDLRDEGILRSKLYLDKIIGVDFIKINNEWEKIQGIRKIRNHLAHEGESQIIVDNKKNGGDIPEILKVLKSFQLAAKTTNPFIDNEDYYLIQLNKGFCEYALQSIQDFLEKLYLQLK